MDKAMKLSYIDREITNCSDAQLSQIYGYMVRHAPGWAAFIGGFADALTNRRERVNRIMNFLRQADDEDVDVVYQYIANNI